MTTTRPPKPGTHTLTADEYKESVLIRYLVNYDWRNEPIFSYIELSRSDYTRRLENDTYQTYTENHYRILTNPNDPLANWTSAPEAYTSQESIDAANRLLDKTLRQKETTRRNGRKTHQYKTILAEANRLQWPRSYRDDLIKHDAYTLGKEQPHKFLWCIRESGTWLFMPTYATKQFRKAVVHNAPKDQKYYLYDDSRREASILTEITAQQWADYQDPPANPYQ